MIVISFQTTSAAMMADGIFTKANVKKKVIPIPRALGNSCGMALQIERDDIEISKQVIHENNLPLKGIFDVEDENAVKLY